MISDKKNQNYVFLFSCNNDSRRYVQFVELRDIQLSDVVRGKLGHSQSYTYATVL